MFALCSLLPLRVFLIAVSVLAGGVTARESSHPASACRSITIGVSIESDSARTAPREKETAEKKPGKEAPVKITITDEGIKIGSEGKEKVVLEVDAEKLAEKIQKSLAGVPESLAAVFGGDEDKHYTVVQNSDIVQVGKTIRVADDELVNGDVVAFVSDVHVEGKVMGDVAAIFGDVVLGPDAIVNGQVVSILGTVTKDEGAVVRGETAVVGSRHHARGARGIVWPWGASTYGKGVFGAVSKVVVLVIFTLLMLLILYMISGRMRRAATYLSNSFLKSLGIGLLVLFPGSVFVVVLTIILAITIVGIPVAVLLVMSLVALFMLGFLTSALELGRFVTTKLGMEADSPYVHGVIGLCLLALLGIIGSFMSLSPFLGHMSGVFRAFGFLVNFVALVFGVGAFVASKGGSQPPPAPLPPSA